MATYSLPPTARPSGTHGSAYGLHAGVTLGQHDVALHAISLCTGAAGLDLGVELAIPGTRIVCGVERNAFAAANLIGRMEARQLDDFPIWSDLRTFSAREWRGCVDLVTAGYPCQPFSVAGKGLAGDDERHLWPDVARVIDECEPGLVFLENVANHLSQGFDEVARDLHGLGFQVAASLWTAAEVGAPHRRERLFALAVHSDRIDIRAIAERCETRWQHVQRRRQAIAVNDGEARSAADADEVRCERLAQEHGTQRGLGIEHWHNADRLRLADAWCGHSPEPGIHGVAHGMAGRLDRLRLCGNGVVPLQAAAAFHELACALGGIE